MFMVLFNFEKLNEISFCPFNCIKYYALSKIHAYGKGMRRVLRALSNISTYDKTDLRIVIISK